LGPQRLAIKFALTTMLRSSELLGMHRDEWNTVNGTPSVDIPARRVKKRRVITQPLWDPALEPVPPARIHPKRKARLGEPGGSQILA
jgi:integrase